MLKQIRFLAILVALTLGIVATTGNAFAQTTSCDTSGSVNGTATPAVGTVGTTINFMATGFTVGEDVSFWFTLPDGTVVGTAQPLPGGVNPDGSIGPLPFGIDQALVNIATGRWAITFQGASSNHQAIIYFCVLTVAEATAVAQPTSPPATATSAPATATTAATVAPTDTSVPATAEATAEATSTTAAPPIETSVPPTAVPVAPTAEIPTAAPVIPVEATATTAVLPVATEVTPGMPTTGNSGDTFLGVLALLVVAVSAISLGWLARRNATR